MMMKLFFYTFFYFHKKTLILFTSLLKRREVKLNNPNTVLLLIIKSTFAVIYFVEIFWIVNREETAELQFGLNQCLIRVGIYPQLQSVLQTSHSDCPISDVWPQYKEKDWNEEEMIRENILTTFNKWTFFNRSQKISR